MAALAFGRPLLKVTRVLPSFTSQLISGNVAHWPLESFWVLLVRPKPIRRTKHVRQLKWHANVNRRQATKRLGRCNAVIGHSCGWLFLFSPSVFVCFFSRSVKPKTVFETMLKKTSEHSGWAEIILSRRGTRRTCWSKCNKLADCSGSAAHQK